MTKNYIQIIPGTSFEMIFGSGPHAGKTRAMGHMNLSGEKHGDWPKENSAHPVPRDWLKIPGGTVFNVRFNHGKHEGETHQQGAYSADGYKYGDWSACYADGKPRYTGSFAARGKKCGHWVGFHPNGQKHYDSYYDLDNPIGRYQTFFDNGKPQHDGLFAQGKVKEGEWVEYNKDGRVLWHVLYRNGKHIQKWQTPDGPADYTFTPKTGIDQFLANDDLFQKQELAAATRALVDAYKL